MELLNPTKGIYKKLTPNVILHGESLKTFPLIDRHYKDASSCYSIQRCAWFFLQ